MSPTADDLTSYITCIRNATLAYFAWHQWDGDIHKKVFEMKDRRKDWECLGAMYRFHKKQFYLRKAVEQHFKNPHEN